MKENGDIRRNGEVSVDAGVGRGVTSGAKRAPCCAIRRTKIRTDGLTVRYGDVEAVRGVSLDIPAECITAVVGPSGCGKSTFLSAINRMTDLIPGCAVSGEISFEGVSIHDPSADVIALRRRVGMIFQKPNPFPLSIRANITFPLKQHGVRVRAERERLLEESLRDVGLWEEVKDRLDAPARRLSGGQQQRLCLARALALRPEAILLDEPCSALDPMASAVVEDLILSLRGRYTIVIVTHNLAQARRIADNAAFFWTQGGAGEMIEQGEAERIFESPRHELTAAYIEGVRG